MWHKRTRATARHWMSGLAVTAALVATSAQSTTLADALVGAYNHSGLIDQNRALLRAADEDVLVTLTTADAGDDPRLTKLPITDVALSNPDWLICLKARARMPIVKAFFEVAQDITQT